MDTFSVASLQQALNASCTSTLPECRAMFYGGFGVIIYFQDGTQDTLGTRHYISLADHPGLEAAFVTDFTPFLDAIGSHFGLATITVHGGGSAALKTMCKTLCENHGVTWVNAEKPELPSEAPLNFNVDMSNFFRYRITIEGDRLMILHGNGEMEIPFKPEVTIQQTSYIQQLGQTVTQKLGSEQQTRTNSKVLYFTDFPGVCTNMELTHGLPYTGMKVLSKANVLMTSYTTNGGKHTFENHTKASMVFQLVCVILTFQKLTNQDKQVYVVFEQPK